MPCPRRIILPALVSRSNTFCISDDFTPVSDKSDEKNTVPASSLLICLLMMLLCVGIIVNCVAKIQQISDKYKFIR